MPSYEEAPASAYSDASEEEDDLQQWIDAARVSLRQTWYEMEAWADFLTQWRRYYRPSMEKIKDGDEAEEDEAGEEVRCFRARNDANAARILNATAAHLRLLDEIEADPEADDATVKIQSVVTALLYINHRVSCMEQDLCRHAYPRAVGSRNI